MFKFILAISILIPSFSFAAAPDACSLLTPDLLKQNIGYENAKAASKPSYIGGSTCVFSSATQKTDLILTFQISRTNAKQYFHPENEQKDGERLNTSEFHAVIIPPKGNSGNSRFVVMKGDTYADFALWTTKKYTPTQFKSLFKAIAAKL